MGRRALAALPADLWRLTAADFIVRAAYQMGKTPLLPLYAAALGAGEILIGLVVSVSTATGLFLKPLFGLLSDRTGRRVWLAIGLCVFAGAPFLYRFVETPDQLFALRLLHGLATAIFGPVSLAYVAEMGAARRAERLGLFGMARSGGHLVAPLAASALLTVMPPEQVFTLIGFLSLAAFPPVLALAERRPQGRAPAGGGLLRALIALRDSRAFWLVAGLETATHVATYALKAFLPIYALGVAGHDLILVGAFFTAQELAHMLTRPFGGRFADRAGAELAVCCGLCLLGAALLALPGAAAPLALLAVAAAIGAAMGLILPATLSMLGAEMPADGLGLGMGALGALRNGGKILGPILGGAVIAMSDYHTLFTLCAAFALVTALALAAMSRRRRQA